MFIKKHVFIFIYKFEVTFATALQYFMWHGPRWDSLRESTTRKFRVTVPLNNQNPPSLTEPSLDSSDITEDR